jgi:hypothetical protein
MKNDKDVIFKYYNEPGQIPRDCDFSYFGDEGSDSLAFDKYAYGYKNGAEAIYEKLCAPESTISELDTLVFPLCFVYRHMVELLIKYLYRKHSCVNDDDFKKFLNEGGHNLMSLWNATKPVITNLQKGIKTSVDIAYIEHYVTAFDEFDEKSFRMRYPIDKKLSNSNKGISRLDFHNLHHKMSSFYDDIIKFSREISNQITEEVNSADMERFESEFQKVKDVIPEILRLENDYKKSKCQNNSLYNYVNNLADNQLITLCTIYRCGQQNFTLPIDIESRRKKYLTGCVLTMKDHNLSYDKGINRTDCSCFLYKKWRCINDSFSLALNILK